MIIASPVSVMQAYAAPSVSLMHTLHEAEGWVCFPQPEEAFHRKPQSSALHENMISATRGSLPQKAQDSAVKEAVSAGKQSLPSHAQL